MVRAAILRLLPATLVALFPAAGLASPLELPSLGDAVFSGPTHAHPSSIYISPAAVGLGLKGHQLYAGGLLQSDRIEVERLLVDPERDTTSEGPTASYRSFYPAGTLAYTYTGPRISGGISLHTPYAESFASGDDTLRYHALGGYHYQAMLSGAGAVRVSDEFIFGASLSLAYSWFSLNFDRDTALAAGRNGSRGIDSDCGGEVCGLEHPQAAQRYELDFRTGNVGDLFETRNAALSISALYRFAPGWWVGASFSQPPGGFGALSLAGDARIRDAPRDGERIVEGKAELQYRLPQTLRVGLRGPVLPDYELVFGLVWKNASRHERLDLRFLGDAFEGESVPAWQPRYRGFRDVVRTSAGIEGRPGEALRLGARLRFDSGATARRALSPLQVAGPSATLAGSAALRIADNTVLTAGYEFGWHPTQTAEPSAFDPIARLDCVESGYDFDVCEAAREGRALPTAAGRYSRVRHAARLSLRYDAL